MHVGDCDCSRSITPSLMTKSSSDNESSDSISARRLNPGPLPCLSRNSLTCVTLRLYCDPAKDSIPMLLPALSTTVYGLGLNGVENLFSLSCLTRTLSPTSMLLSRRLVSAYSFPFPLFSESRSPTSMSSAFNCYKSGILVRILHLNKSSAGLTPVVVFGVLR